MIRSILASVATAILVSSSLAAQGRARVQFRDFPIAEHFTGPIAVVDLGTIPSDGPYNMKELVSAEAVQGPNFAGHFRIVDASCGTSCGSVLIVDERTGKVYGGPSTCAGEDHRIDSDLLVADPKAKGESVCSDPPVFYRWVGHELLRLDLADEPPTCRTHQLDTADADPLTHLRQYLASLPDSLLVAVRCSVVFALVRFRSGPSVRNDSAFALVQGFVAHVLTTYRPVIDSSTSASDLASFETAIRPYGLALTRAGARYRVAEIPGWLRARFSGRLTQ